MQLDTLIATYKSTWEEVNCKECKIVVDGDTFQVLSRVNDDEEFTPGFLMHELSNMPLMLKSLQDVRDRRKQLK